MSGLGISVQQLVDGVRKETDTATAQAREEISLATIVMLALGVGTLVGSVLFVWLYVGRSILRRIRALQSSMKLLSDGDLDSEIYRSAQNDEIAEMSESLQVFRESMIAARAMTADQDKDRVAKAERASRMEARIVEFETTVRGALDSLQASANSMQSTAQSMSTSADQSSALVKRGRLRRRRDLGQRADRLLRHRGTVVVDLRDRPPGRELGRDRPQGGRGSRRHRRHHAGPRRQRGAHQRRGRPDPDHRLADQPAGAQRHHRGGARRRSRPRLCGGRLRGEEPRQPDRESDRRDPPADRRHAERDDDGGRRRSATSPATIGEINDVTTAIAAAVEEQGAATREIARNIQHAAGGTSEVSSNIVGVSNASNEAGTAAGDVLTASDALRREADVLRAEIDAFLSNIRAA